jgi:hypothetical protein
MLMESMVTIVHSPSVIGNFANISLELINRPNISDSCRDDIRRVMQSSEAIQRLDPKANIQMSRVPCGHLSIQFPPLFGA